MVTISVLFLVIGGVTLVVGWISQSDPVLYVSIASALVAAVLLIVAALQDRRLRAETAPPGEVTPAAPAYPTAEERISAVMPSTAAAEEEEEEEEEALLEEEEEEEEVFRARARRPAARARPKAKPKAKAPAKAKAKAAASRAKAKTPAKPKAKPKPKTKGKAKPKGKSPAKRRT